MSNTNVQQDAENLFKLRFIKLGFNETKSQVAKFSRDKIIERLEQFSLPESGTIPLESITLDEVKTETEKVLSTLYQGVGLKVDYLENELQNQKLIDEYKRLSMLYKMGKINIEGVMEQMLRVYNSMATKIKVFNIPVEPLEELDSMQGLTFKGPLLLIGNPEIMVKKAPIYIEFISLGNRYDKLSIGTYTHEITHALLDRHKGVIENYYNDEFLSIFMEKVAVDQVDSSSDEFLVKCSEVHRLAHVKKLLKELNTYKKDSSDYKDCLKYIQSSLYAGILFNKYSKANDVQKQAILEQVKSVLNGKTKLNNFIQNQQLSIEGEEVFEYIDKIERYAIELNERRKTELDFEASEMCSEEMQIKAIVDGNKIATELQTEENTQKKDE